MLLDGGTFALPLPDQQPYLFLTQWGKSGTGVYASNGCFDRCHQALTSRARSSGSTYIFSLPGFFQGYQPGYSKLFECYHNQFTWAILKARTTNTGRVQLTSCNSCDLPDVNFQYFRDGTRENDPDLEAVVDGVKFARSINQRLSAVGLIKDERVLAQLAKPTVTYARMFAIRPKVTTPRAQTK